MSNVVTEFIETNWQLVVLFIILAIIFNFLFIEFCYWLYDTIKTKLKNRVIVIPHSDNYVDLLIPLTVTYISKDVPNGYTWKTQIPLTTDQNKIRQALEKDLTDNIIAYDFKEEK